MEAFILSMLIFLISCLTWGEKSVKASICPFQPEVLINLYTKINKDMSQCIFLPLLDTIKSENISRKSSLIVKESKAVPDSQGWSRCQNCGWKDNKFIVFHSDVVNSGKAVEIDLSWSLWGEFFFTTRNDQYKAEIMHEDNLNLIFKSSKNKFLIDRPVYILPMITLHVGHILIDLLQQVYSSMMSTYGVVRTDALIILDVAGEDERIILQEKININSHNTNVDALGIVLNLLTDLPILSMQTFNEISGENSFILFTDVHIGLDNSDAFFYKGYDIHPMVMPVENQSNQSKKLAERYIDFQTFVRNGIRYHLWKKYSSKNFSNNSDTNFNYFDDLCNEVVVANYWKNRDMNVSSENFSSNSTESPHPLELRLDETLKKVLFVQREKNRVILSLKSLLDNIEKQGAVFDVTELGSMSFSEQVCLFQHTDVLVAVAGTAIHNMLFMRPGTSVIIIMQPEWCDWAWMYANQAVLLGIDYYIYCSDTHKTSSSYSESSHLSKYFNFKQQNNNKSESFTHENTVDGILEGYHWTKKTWLQGPRMTKSGNVTVDVDIFHSLLKSALSSNQRDHNKTNLRYSRNNKSNDDNHTNVNQTRIEKTYHTQNQKILEIFISSINIEELVIKNSEKSIQCWKISLMGEIVSMKGQIEGIIGHMPHFVICLKSLLSMSEAYCYALDGFNYYAHLYLTVTDTIQLLHVWAQVSNDGGKIKGSDVYFALDVLLPQGGLLVHTESIGLNIREEIILELNSNIDEMNSSDGNNDTSKNRRIVFSQYISDRYTLQRSIAAFCEKNMLVPVSCGYVSARISLAAYKAVFLKDLALPNIQYLPTPEIPLIFIHIEKTGGTTLREFITESADKLGLEYFIPCHGGIHCVTLSLNGSSSSDLKDTHHVKSLTNISIVAGHFFWDVWQQLPSASKISENPAELSVSENTNDFRDANLNKAKAVPPCLIMGRHPFERAISYYYQRCYMSKDCVGYGRRFNDLSADELYMIATSKRQGEYMSDNRTVVVIDEGMEDAACRALANEKATTGLIVGVDEIIIPPTLSDEAINTALNNVEQCVVGVLEKWEDTKEVLSFWFPWMDFTEQSDRRKMFLFSGKETSEELKPELKSVLLQVSNCDMLLYEKMLKIFEVQLSVIKTAAFDSY